MTTRNRIPRHRNGARDWTRLDAHERIVLAALYREPGRTADELRAATGLSTGQLATTLKGLQSPQRCGPLGVRSVVVRDEAEPERYTVSEAWAGLKRLPAPTRRAA